MNYHDFSIVELVVKMSKSTQCHHLNKLVVLASQCYTYQVTRPGAGVKDV